jgi:hypothetical protein
VVAASSIRKQRYRYVLANQSLSKIFDDKFFEMVERRRNETDARHLKLVALQFPIFLCLVLVLLPGTIKFSFFGITPDDVRSLREALLVLSAVIGFGASLLASHSSHLKEILEARTERALETNEDAQKLYRVGYGIELEWWPRPLEKGVERGFAFNLVTGLIWIIGIALFLLLVVSAFVIQILLLSDIYSAPNYSRNVSIGVITFVVGTYFLSLLINIRRSGPVPYVTNEWKAIFHEWKKKRPEVHDGIMRVAELQHQNKGWLRRLLSRPTPIRVARKLHRDLETDKRISAS